MQRLDRALSEHTTLSRAEIKRRIQRGEVLVNGAPAGRPEQKIDPARDAVTLAGESVPLRFLYLMLNKPRGVVSATRDKALPTVIDLVPPALRRKNLFPAGRLDRDSEGFVLLTDDGAFAHRILSPKTHVPKTYLCEVAGPLAPDTAARFAAGMALADGSVCRPAVYELLRGGDPLLARVVLREGMYHQIRRMFAACGGEVLRLRRVMIGALALDEALAPGECRELAPQEVARIGTEHKNAC